MEQEELKRKLIGLWEKNTHQSKDLISILFDYYFDAELVEYKEYDGKIVSALFGIPYSFGYGDKYLKGLYLISLSSEEGFKKKGMLSDLLKAFNKRASKNFDFTFIVPHSELLADYYATQGYLNSFFILEERFTPLHDFKKDYFLSLTDSDERIKELKKSLYKEIKVCENQKGEFSEEQVIQFIRSIEKKGTSAINLCHSSEDLKYLLNEKSLRNLNHYITHDSDGKITGIAFSHMEDIKRIRIAGFYVSDLCSYYVLLDYIKKTYPDFSLSVNSSDSKYQTHSIIQQTYASSNPAGGDLDNTFSVIEIPFNYNRLLQPLGMARLLRFDNILKYIAETRSDIDLKLYLRDWDGSQEKEGKTVKKLFTIKNGTFKEENILDPIKDHSVLSLSSKELSELLLRKNDSSNLIMEAFGIPRLNLQIKLLPY